MNKYKVTLLVDASMTIEVEAECKKYARDEAERIAKRPIICHQCACKVEIGDVSEAVEAVRIWG